MMVPRPLGQAAFDRGYLSGGGAQRTGPHEVHWWCRDSGYR